MEFTPFTKTCIIKIMRNYSSSLLYTLESACLIKMLSISIPQKKHKRISAIYIGYKSTQLIMRSITWARFQAFLLLFWVPIVFCILEFVKYYYCKMHFKPIRFIFVDITEMYNTQSIEIGFILLLFWSILFQLDNEKRIHTS